MTNKKGSILKNLALLSYIGIAMVIPILIGVLGGRWLDERMGTGPLFLFLFIVVGVYAGGRNVYRLAVKDLDPPDGSGKRK